MSHFAVLVKISPEKLLENDGDVNAAVESLLAPYQENNMGDCPSKYLQFIDTTQEVLDNSVEVIESDSHFGKSHPSSVGKTRLEHYGNLDLIASEWCGYKVNSDGRYGYWENPNAKWDWWQIGGRYAGWLPKKIDIPEGDVQLAAYYLWKDAGQPESSGIDFYYKAEQSLRKEFVNDVLRGSPSLLFKDFEYADHHGDVLALKDIDFNSLNSDGNEDLETFWKNYLRWKELKSNSTLEKNQEDVWLDFDVPSLLRKLGLCQGDVFHEFTLHDLKTKYKWNWEFSTFAVLEKDGIWHERGSMGWFGISTDSTEDRNNWCQSFFDRFIKNENPETLCVIVDCHI